MKSEHFARLQLAQLEHLTRRHFLEKCTTGLGAMFLAGASGRAWGSSAAVKRDPTNPLAPGYPHFAAKAKRVIYLHMAGAPSQHELFDYKPELLKLNGRECPKEFLEGKQFAFIQGVPKMLGPQFPFKQYGQSGTWVSEIFPNIARHVDDMAFTPRAHARQHGADAVKHTLDVHVDHLVPFANFQRVHRRQRHDTCVVNHDINPAPCIFSGLYK